MALAFKRKNLDGLNDDQKALYKKEGDFFVLDVEGVDESDDFIGLKRQNETLLTEKKEAARKAKEAEEAAQQAIEEKARQEGDYKTLLETAEKKLNDTSTRLETSEKLYGDLTKTVETGAIKNASIEAAAKLADGANQKHLSRFIADRLHYQNGNIIVRDMNGQDSKMSLDDLVEEFKGNDEYASLVTGSKASGGGARPSNSSTGGANPQGNLAGNTQERQAAIAGKYPDLPVK